MGEIPYEWMGALSIVYEIRGKSPREATYIENAENMIKTLEDAECDDDNIFKAAILYDAVNDGKITMYTIHKRFSQDVCDILEETRYRSQFHDGQSRKLLMEEIYTMQSESLVLLVADKLNKLTDEYTLGYDYQSKPWMVWSYQLCKSAKLELERRRSDYSEMVDNMFEEIEEIIVDNLRQEPAGVARLASTYYSRVKLFI